MAAGKPIPSLDPTGLVSQVDQSRTAFKANSGLLYRVGMAYPLQIKGLDQRGEPFVEVAHTQFIMRDGVTLVTSRRLAPGTYLEIRRSKQQLGTGSVVGQTGITKSGNVYAVTMPGDPAALWGIHFPELLEQDRVTLTCLLGCKTCRAQAVVQLTAVEYEMLATSERVHRPCEACNGTSVWTRVPNAAGPSTKQEGRNRRRYSRVSVKLWGYIVEGGNEDSVPILDMSRDGIRFRSSIKYESETVVQVAVAYMAGTANIFVPGRIVWRSGEQSSEYEYGLRFMSRSPIM